MNSLRERDAVNSHSNAICVDCGEWKVVRSRGRCNNCYRAFLKQAKADGTYIPLVAHKMLTPFQKVMKRTEQQADGGCWLYVGLLATDGYARVKDASTDLALLVHRVSYEELVGPIPDGLVLDHLCRVRNCVNPAHLEPVTSAENVRRGVRSRLGDRDACPVGHAFTVENTTFQRRKTKTEGVTYTPICRTCRNEQLRTKRREMGPQPRKRSSRCSNGHEYTPENTKWYKPTDGQTLRRRCRTCERAANRRHRERQKYGGPS